MKTSIFEHGHKVLAFVFYAVPQDTQRFGDVEDGIKIIVENRSGILCVEHGWHTDEHEIIHHLRMCFMPLDLRITAASAGRPWIPSDKARPKKVQCSTHILSSHITATYGLCSGLSG